MIELETLDTLQEELKTRIDKDRKVLEEMCSEVRPLKAQTFRIHPRSATAISLVGTDGGNNQLRFDPFQVQLVRVVDSSHNEYCLEVITPRTPLSELTNKHRDEDGSPLTPLGRMMEYLGAPDLSALSPVFNPDPDQLSASWMNVYREMMEWAVLFELVREKDFGTDTVIVCDGFLRSKMFKGKLFGEYKKGLEEGIRRQFEKNRRRIYICGIAKYSSVLQAYRIAMAIEGVMRTGYPCYVEVPEYMEERVYEWDEYVKRLDKFVAGKMFLVKFGKGIHDPVWAIDIFHSQKGEAQTIFGYLLEDAKDGFPIPLYPQCLQKAHENAALVDFDMELLEDQICAVLREGLGDKKWVIDELALQEADPAARRYS
jgi:hypothetical protein